MCNPQSTGFDILLWKIMDPNTQPEPLDKPKSLTASKRPRPKRKLNQANTSAKPSYNPPIYGGKSNNNENNTVQTVHKRRKTSINVVTQNE